MVSEAWLRSVPAMHTHFKHPLAHFRLHAFEVLCFSSFSISLSGRSGRGWTVRALKSQVRELRAARILVERRWPPGQVAVADAPEPNIFAAA